MEPISSVIFVIFTGSYLRHFHDLAVVKIWIEAVTKITWAPHHHSPNFLQQVLTTLHTTLLATMLITKLTLATAAPPIALREVAD